MTFKQLIVGIFVLNVADEGSTSLIPPLEMLPSQSHQLRPCFMDDFNVFLGHISYTTIVNPGSG